MGTFKNYPVNYAHYDAGRVLSRIYYSQQLSVFTEIQRMPFAALPHCDTIHCNSICLIVFEYFFLVTTDFPGLIYTRPDRVSNLIG
jgi:hypothetical protein